MLLNHTFGGGGAWVVGDAGVDTVALHTTLVLGTILVDLTLDSLTPDKRISEEARWTFASRGVVSRYAFGIDGARVVDEARIHALVVVADLVLATIRVDDALD